MPISKLDPNSLDESVILPNGVAMVGHINDHIVANLRVSGPSRLNLPSMWQEALTVVTERVPLKTFRARFERPGYRR